MTAAYERAICEKELAWKTVYSRGYYYIADICDRTPFNNSNAFVGDTTLLIGQVTTSQ